MNKLTQKIAIGVSAITLGIALFASSAFAATTVHYGPFNGATPDSGTCGNNWANDTFDRFFSVDTTQNANLTYNVTEYFKNGAFVTVAGQSPAACQTLPGPTGNGNTVGTGVTGKFQGSFDIVVTGGTYNPNAVCTQATCGTTAGFIATVFGGGATYTVPTYLFNYNADSNGQWKNSSANRGGNLGDITGN